MEESEKRKQRLSAMRTAAVQAEHLNHNETLPSPSCLSNPFIESPGRVSSQEDSGATPRFNYYTDPLSTFSGNKKNNTANEVQESNSTFSHVHQITSQLPSPLGPKNLESSLSSVHQWQPSYSPNHRTYQSHTPQQNFTTYQSPRGNFHPPPLNEVIPPQGWNGSPGTPSFYHASTAPRGNNMPSPATGHLGSPSFPRSPSLPSPSFGHRGRHNFTPRHGGSPWRGSSPGFISFMHGSGRGRGQFGRSPNSGRSSGQRGSGFHSRGSGSGWAPRPEHFYDKSMVEDPWKDLSPILWTSVESSLSDGFGGTGSQDSWMPKSIRSKKPKVGSSPNNFGGGLNLAEFLAASFNETANETEDR